MIHRVLVLTAWACCALVMVSFVLFARDQLAGASQQQQNSIATATSPNPGSVPVTHTHAQPRRFIDGAASTLTSPFRSLVHTDSQWALHIVPTLCSLLIYGFGLGFLARYART